MNDIKFTPCEWRKLAPLVEAYVTDNRITVESFWEEHVIGSRHYLMTCRGETAGFFAIHGGDTLMLFYVYPQYSKHTQELMARVKRYEMLTNAMVVTGDEFFMSHCLDAYARIEKQAYLSIYTERAPSTVLPLTLRLADVDADAETLALAGDFLEGEIKQLKEGRKLLELYIAELESEVVGFGVVEYGKIAKGKASIGMFTRPELRGRGIASNILHHMKLLVNEKGYAAMSGCWYYNHNSKKSMESAGAYVKTRMVRFYF